MIIDGDTTIFFLTDEGERAAHLGAGQLVVVPQGTWHRFETPERVTLWSVTPQPTDHTPDRPT
jgi:mannose-6-phosphate isomerase-like protein (cupin superfamily)